MIVKHEKVFCAPFDLVWFSFNKQQNVEFEIDSKEKNFRGFFVNGYSDNFDWTWTREREAERRQLLKIFFPKFFLISQLPFVVFKVGFFQIYFQRFFRPLNWNFLMQAIEKTVIDIFRVVLGSFEVCDDESTKNYLFLCLQTTHPCLFEQSHRCLKSVLQHGNCAKFNLQNLKS